MTGIAASSRRPAATALLAPLLAAALLQGCAVIPWFGRAKDPTPPAELSKTAPQEASLRVLWKARVGKGDDGRQLSLRVAADNGRVYTADARGRIAALAAGDGRVLWERKTDLAFSGGPGVAGDDLVIGTSDGALLLLSSRDGSQRWRAQLSSEVLSIPLILDELVIVHTSDDHIHALERSDGSKRWSHGYDAPTLTLRGSSSPAPGPNGILVGVSGGRLVYLDTEAGVPIWEVIVSPPSGRSELERIADIDADPLVVDDTVYTISYNGDLAAIEIATGTVLWRRELSGYAGLTADGGSLFITDADDNVWAADPADGAGRWKQDALLHRRLTAPVTIDGMLALGDLEGYVHLIAQRDGRLLGRERITKDPLTAAPTVSGNTLYLRFGDGTVAAARAARAGRAAAEAAAEP
ncbi:MAG: outer membrane protein assembly factor BamB, partial [Deinococcus-Thermus bacterium]|nr:outer membrane protein assembly factor BamB [Deinococcota bacterium]